MEVNNYEGVKYMAGKSSKDIKELMVLGLLAAFLIPVALNQLFSVNTSTWDTQTAAMFIVIPVAIVIVVVLLAFDKI